MPGILLNRLSRPKEGETPEQVLENGRLTLLGEMLPVICPNASEGADYLYFADIVSRLDTNKEGAILDRALQVIRADQCDWIAVTEISRISGDGESMFSFLGACRDHRVPIYTKERLYHPFQPWRAASYQELSIAFFLSMMEVTQYMVRSERFREGAMPINSKTHESRNALMQGLGRHINGRVPIGYTWNRLTKQPEPDDTIPFPDYIPPTKDTPPAMTWWEIARYARQLGVVMGVNQVSELLALETGAHFEPSVLIRLWRNPFYAGRPTSTLQRIGGRLVKRTEQVYTIGTYPALATWEEHCALIEAIERRANNGAKTNVKGNWATGIIRCACGQPFISNGGYYICRGAKRATDIRCEQTRQTRVGQGYVQDRHKLPDGWVRSETCGIIDKRKIHNTVEAILQEVFARPDLADRLAVWQQQHSEGREDRQSLYRQRDGLHEELLKLDEQRQRAIDLAVEGMLKPLELQARQDKIERERKGLAARLLRLEASLSAPSVPPAALSALQIALQHHFEDFWHDPDILTDNQRALIVSSLIDYVPVTGIKHRRVFGTPVLFSSWLQEINSKKSEQK